MLTLGLGAAPQSNRSVEGHIPALPLRRGAADSEREGERETACGRDVAFRLLWGRGRGQ